MTKKLKSKGREEFSHKILGGKLREKFEYKTKN